jgi:hypothetical protein
MQRVHHFFEGPAAAFGSLADAASAIVVQTKPVRIVSIVLRLKFVQLCCIFAGAFFGFLTCHLASYRPLPGCAIRP